MVAVGTRISPRPPHRSRRALLTHRAPPSGFGVEAVFFALFEEPDSLTSSEGASATLEEAMAKYRAQPVFLPNGKPVALGEVEDMDPENRRFWSANMREADPDDIE